METADVDVGYERQKDFIEEQILLQLKHLDVFREAARLLSLDPSFTLFKNAVLFTGPPGTGKTKCARCNFLHTFSSEMKEQSIY